MNTAMIWGAKGAIGQALADELMQRGWQVIGISRDPLDRTDMKCLEADFSKNWEVEKAVYASAMDVEKIDLWIYAAGDIISQSAAETAPEEWQRILDANLNGPFLAVHHSLPLLADDAVMVFLGAVSERLQLPGLSAYAAAKAGLEAFVTALRKEQRKKQVILVRPGAVDTPFWEKVPMKLPAKSPSAQKVALKILEAVEKGHQGTLDLI